MENVDPENYKKKKKNCNHKLSYYNIAKTYLLFFIIIFIYARNILQAIAILYINNTQKNLIYTSLNQI